MKNFKVNVHYSIINDCYSTSIVEDNENDYLGHLYGTHYTGLGSDTNYYGAFFGSYEECENWIKRNNNNLKDFC